MHARMEEPPLARLAVVVAAVRMDTAAIIARLRMGARMVRTAMHARMEELPLARLAVVAVAA